MILVKLVSYLNENLGVFVGTEAPEQLTGYVLVDQTGSNTRNHITTTTFAIQSYGATLYEAYELNERVKTAMNEILELNEISSAKLETDYNFTDTETKQYRWQAVYHITHYLGGI